MASPRSAHAFTALCRCLGGNPNEAAQQNLGPEHEGDCCLYHGDNQSDSNGPTVSPSHNTMHARARPFFGKRKEEIEQDPTVHGRPSGKQREEQSAGDRGHKYLEVVEF